MTPRTAKGLFALAFVLVGVAVFGILRSSPHWDPRAPEPPVPRPTAEAEASASGALEQAPEPQAESGASGGTLRLPGLELPGCGEGVRPSGENLGHAVTLVQEELRDRAYALPEDASDTLRQGVRSVLSGQDVDAGLAALERAPDRTDAAGYDHAAAGAFWSMVHAMVRDDEPEAEARLERLERIEASTSALGALARAVWAGRKRDDVAQRDALRRAVSRDAEWPGVALSLAILEVRQGHGRDALNALDAYRREVPECAWADAIRPLVERRARIENALDPVQRDGVDLHHPPDMEPAEVLRIHHTVIGALDEASELLGGPRRPALNVFVYGSRSAFRQATCGSSWTAAMFDGSLRIARPTIGAPSERDVLRHESLHAQLRFAAPSAPLWFHEGVAQRFHQRPPPDLQRWLALVAREGSLIPFPSIEGSFVVIEDAQSARFAYHQSYAMVAAVLAREPDALVRATEFLSGGGDASGLLAAMSDDPLDQRELLHWIRSER